MKRVEAEKKCACCGHQTKVYDVMSGFIGDLYLDGKPVPFKNSNKLMECPFCHYVNTRIESLINDNVKEVVQSIEYKQLFEDGIDLDNALISEIEKHSVNQTKAFLMLIDDPVLRIKSLLNLCWQYENLNEIDEAQKYRKKAVEEFSDLVKSDANIDVSDGLIFVDCLRRLKLFDEARNVLNDIGGAFLGDVFAHAEEYIIYVFEKQLIDKLDDKPYKKSEVSLG